MNIATIRRYLDIFEQSFIIFPLKPYSKVGRDEIGKMNKYYFSEIDLILTKNEETLGVEIKTGGERVNQAFLNRYPKARMQTITPLNFY